MTKTLLPSLAMLLVLGASVPVALAFPFDTSWHMASSGRSTGAMANRAGAGDIYYTGGAQDYHLGCASCHTGGGGAIDLTLTPTPAFGTMGGEDTYHPGQTYSFAVQMVGEHLHGSAPNDNLNQFALTIEDLAGHRAGAFASDSGQTQASCPAAPPTTWPGGTTLLYGDCHAIVSHAAPNVTSWTFGWTAPAAGAGDLTIYVGAVDGDHDGSSSLGDDVVQRSFTLLEGP